MPLTIDLKPTGRMPVIGGVGDEKDTDYIR